MPLLGLFSLSASVAYVLALHFSNSVYDGWLYDSLNSLASDVVRTDGGVNLDLPIAARRLFEWDVADRTYFAVYLGDGRIIGGRDDLPAVPRNSALFRKAILFDATLDGRRVRVASMTLPAEPGIDSVRIEVAETVTKRLALARDILIGTLLPQVAIIALVAGVVWFGIRRGLMPLETIAQRIGAQRRDRLAPIPDTDVPREAQPLTQALNSLLTELDRSMRAQRKFVADTAHQLRTPLTALKINIEQAILETDPAGKAALLENLRRAVERATRLSTQLLTLARAEPDTANVHRFERCDLLRIAFEVGSEWVPRALERRIDLGFDTDENEPPVWVFGDAGLLHDAIANLVDNAIKYHPGGGNVSLRVTGRPQPTVEVLDDGRGIPSALHESVFQRFHRGDRSSGQGGGGSGLGLAIVREIAELHGGRVSLGIGLNGNGLRVSLILPSLGE